MKKDWDSIVVGAGVGGLTAAACLGNADLRVLVLERNPHPGGTAYVYHRKGFTFPMGPLGFSDPGLVQDTLKGLGVATPLELSRVHYRIRAFDLDIPISLTFPEVSDALETVFPGETNAIHHFFKDVEDTLASPREPGSQPKRTLDRSASEYLHSLTKNWKLRRILGSIGTREPYSSFSLLAAMWNLMCEEGIWYPKEGMRSFCNRLVQAMKRDGAENESGGGEIRLNTEVKKIRIEEGRALGVTLVDGTEIDAATVISDADYKKTFIQLIDPESISPKWHHAVSAARQTGSVLQVCLGIDEQKADLSAFEKADRIITRRDGRNREAEDLDWEAPEIDPEDLAAQELEVSLWGKGEATVSPRKRAVIVIRAEAEYAHFARYRTAPGKRSPDYGNYKTRLARALLRQTENLIPGLESATLVMDVATPLTFEDQGGRSGGAVAGWSWDFEDVRDEKPKELVRTPVHGLYMAGYQAFSALFMGGIPTAMESGKRAAKAVLEGAGPIDKILIPGVR